MSLIQILNRIRLGRGRELDIIAKHFGVRCRVTNESDYNYRKVLMNDIDLSKIGLCNDAWRLL